MDAKWTKDKSALISRLKRIEGQLRGVQAMMEREDDCEKIAQQLSAARKALDKAFYQMMACAMEKDLMQRGDGKSHEAENAIGHFTQMMAKYA